MVPGAVRAGNADSDSLRITELAKRSTSGASIARAAGRLGQVAAAYAVTEVKHDADEEPDDQSPPCWPWKRGHERERGDRACRCDEPDPGRFEVAREIWLAHAQHKHAH